MNETPGLEISLVEIILIEWKKKKKKKKYLFTFVSK